MPQRHPRKLTYLRAPRLLDSLDEILLRRAIPLRTHLPIAHTAQVMGLGRLIAVRLMPQKPTQRLQRQMKHLDRRLGAAGFVHGSHPLLDRLEGQLEAYFAGRRERFGLPLLMPGTLFQRKAWAALLEIPYGETRSYRQQAEALGLPRGARAVARANGDNLLAILVPCHRVIAADGGPAGYGGGVWRKRWLLELERSHAVSAGGGEGVT